MIKRYSDTLRERAAYIKKHVNIPPGYARGYPGALIDIADELDSPEFSDRFAGEWRNEALDEAERWKRWACTLMARAMQCKSCHAATPGLTQEMRAMLRGETKSPNITTGQVAIPVPSVTVVVAQEFGRYPAGRYKSDGPLSGEAFRELLEAKLKEHFMVRVDFAGAMTGGASWIDEAFRGLPRDRLVVTGAEIDS